MIRAVLDTNVLASGFTNRLGASGQLLRAWSRGELELLGLHSWGADPHALGAWAYFRPGDVTRFAGRIGAAHGRLHFCGEHLAVENRGMEGAMESGERAAAEVLAYE